jgi:hypothetical protein
LAMSVIICRGAVFGEAAVNVNHLTSGQPASSP